MKFFDPIFCDDIRFEVNNKISLMGIYNDKIILNIKDETKINWPIFLRLSLFLRFKPEENEQDPEDFELSYVMNKKIIYKVTNGLNKIKKNDNQFILAFHNQLLPLELGALGFSIKLIKEKNIIYKTEKNHCINVISE